MGARMGWCSDGRLRAARLTAQNGTDSMTLIGSGIPTRTKPVLAEGVEDAADAAKATFDSPP